MKRFWAIFCILILGLGLVACQNKKAPQNETLPQQSVEPNPLDGALVGICIPDNEERWKTDVAVLTQQLQSFGFEVAVEYAAGDPAMQAYQLDKLVEQKACCLVVAPVDSLALLEAQKKAERVAELEARLEALEKRANSGDIINF